MSKENYDEVFSFYEKHFTKFVMHYVTSAADQVAGDTNSTDDSIKKRSPWKILEGELVKAISAIDNGIIN